MQIRRIEVGVMGVNCYLVGCEETKEALLIDPGADATWILEDVAEGGWDVKVVVNTHGHYDHIGANREVLEKTGAKLMIHEQDAEMLTDSEKNLSVFLGGPQTSPAADHTLQDGDIIEVGNTVNLQVLHTPGHTRGCISLYQDGELFTGDTLFSYGVGRTDFAGGSMDQLMESIKNKLLVYPDETRVYPGHNTLSTLGQVKEQNPFIR